MSVELRAITKENWRQCIKLKPSEDQAEFVAPNVFSIAESKFDEHMMPMGIFDGEEMVGFIMFGFDVDDGNYGVQRLMVDAAHQGKGYGRAAMLEAISRCRTMPDCRQVALSCVPDNVAAEKLYESLGFVKTGEVVCGENVMRLFFKE